MDALWGKSPQKASLLHRKRCFAHPASSLGDPCTAWAAGMCWGQPQLQSSAASQMLSCTISYSIHRIPWLKLGGISEPGKVLWPGYPLPAKLVRMQVISIWIVLVPQHLHKDGWVQVLSHWRQEGRGKLNVQHLGQYMPCPGTWLSGM